jgi:ParB family chromosome partitioning protein
MAAEVKVGMVRADSIRVHPRNVRKDLGDLRELTDSIARFGVMQPVTVEHRGDHLRLRHGHRRVAAARLAGLTRIPAIVHTDQLGDADFLVQAVHENTRRRELDRADRAQTVRDLRKLGVPWEVIADEFTEAGSGAGCPRL